mmetsp:Transcript_6900/g.15629  ORF Transcript_6900/g.15629 Transcript_6900/m.15629 type:complete len:95 (-) Transcript_6900:522-806(-)
MDLFILQLNSRSFHQWIGPHQTQDDQFGRDSLGGVTIDADHLECRHRIRGGERVEVRLLDRLTFYLLVLDSFEAHLLEFPLNVELAVGHSHREC